MNNRQLLVIGLIILGIGALWLAANKPLKTTEYDARNFVLNDVQAQYPEAEVAVISTNFTLDSWKIKVRATLNLTSQCPTRVHLYYDYPAKQFATQPPEFITKNCQICINVPGCVILFPEEAIIASHTLPGTSAVTSFLSAYPEATVKAELFPRFGDYSDVWVVDWLQAGGGIETVILDQRGKVLDVTFIAP